MLMSRKTLSLIFVLSIIPLMMVFATENLFQFKAPDIDGEELPLSQFRGKVVLVVNTASSCGYTYQYEKLESIYRKYQDRGFVVLGFPSDDFWQELDSNQEIKEFCEGYQISFPLFAEGPVRGSDKQEVFRFLTEQPSHDGEIWWNFEKFLINRDGKLVDRYRSGQDPDEDPLLAQIESLL